MLHWKCRWLPWHKLRVEMVIDKDNRKLRCSCGRAYGMNDRVQAIIPWDRELEGVYRISQSLKEGR